MGGITNEVGNGKLSNGGDLKHSEYQDHVADLPTSQKLYEHLVKGQLSKYDFTIFHQNIRGLAINKIDDIFVYLQSNPTHVLCISEHHLNMTEIETIRLPNYNLNAKFCRKTFKNGGVCIFTHETLYCSALNLNKFCKEKDLEICAVELHLQSYKIRKICIVTIYRSPSGDFQYFINTFEKVLRKIHTNFNDVILCGDFNINYNINSNLKQSLDSLITSFGLSSIITFPTRIQKESRTIIDNIFINTSKFNNFSIYPSINGLSDHDAQCLTIHDILKYNLNTNAPFTRKFDKLSIADFNNKLSYEIWDNVFSENDVNTSFNNFLNTYLILFNSCFPPKKIQYNPNNKAWLTQGIKISCLHKRKLFMIQRNNNDPNLTVHYRKYCKILTSVIKLAKQKYYNNLITSSSNRNKTIWNIINSSINKKPTNHNITSINVNGNPTYNGQNIAETFNKHFVSIARDMLTTKLKINKTSNHTKPLKYLIRTFNHPFPQINIKYVSIIEVENIAKTLKVKYSHGYDEISTRILKSSIYYISSPLTYIINRMLTTGIFPNRLKFSEVKPLFKTGERNNMSNYRPISLLTSFSKIFERVIYNRLLQHINNNQILANTQFGFRHKSSTDLASYTLIQEVLTALNKKLKVGGIFCDLHKAFDCVNHDILLSKMEFYGILGRANNLIKSYLQNRYQRVQIKKDSKNYYSEWELVTDGVPQGSILGPLFFLIYINDLPHAILDLATPILFADDTSLIISNLDGLHFEKDINTVIQTLDKWFHSNLLFLNFEKTQFLQFLTKNTNAIQLNLTYNNKQISNMDHSKFLGLMINNRLSWEYHIELMIPKLNTATYVIRSLKQLVNSEILKKAYFSLAHSILSYGIIFWGISNHSKIIFKLQKRIIRIIMNVDSRTSCRNLFKQLNILPLQSQYIFFFLMMFMARNRELFVINANVHNFSTRSHNDLHLPIANLTVFQKGVYFSGVKIFNNLPADLKQSFCDVNKFKKALKRFLLENSFYSLEEYYSWKENVFSYY
jgi:exonuclease III